MKYDPQYHHRRTIRLPRYDYSSNGIYFITLCVEGGVCLFGEIVDEKMLMNENGKIIDEEWLKSAKMRKTINLDSYIIMPNHFHAILRLIDEEIESKQQGARSAPLHRAPRSLGSFIAGFKSASTRRLNELTDTCSEIVWQRNYYEHIIRSPSELQRIRTYIDDNPANWDKDEENPINKREN
ncbi:MAG: transposase [bacterium]|nr:transposase [bacterium]